MAYHIEEADQTASTASIQRLWADAFAGFDAAKAASRLRLCYLDNPAGKGTVHLLYADGDGAPKGVQGLHPRTFHFGARRLRAVNLADYAVAGGHRSLGPALMLLRHSVRLSRDRYDLTYGMPNPQSAPLCPRVGLRRLGALQRYAKPLSSGDMLARRMPRWLARCCAPLADRALHWTDGLRGLAGAHRLECRPARWGDPAFDALWARRPQAFLLSERSGSMLTWRFGLPEQGRWQACVAFDRDAVPQGYVIWRLEDTGARVGDFFSPAPETWTTPLMLAFARLARRAGAASVSVRFFGREEVAARLKAAGMFRRPHEAPLFKLEGDLPELDAPENWYFTEFDTDAD